MKNYFLALMCFLALGFAPSCKDDEEDAANCAADYANAYTAAINALIAAETTYASSAQTASDCTTLKAAWQGYIDVLNDFDNCSGFTAQQQADLDQLIQTAETSRDTAC